MHGKPLFGTIFSYLYTLTNGVIVILWLVNNYNRYFVGKLICFVDIFLPFLIEKWSKHLPLVFYFELRGKLIFSSIAQFVIRYNEL